MEDTLKIARALLREVVGELEEEELESVEQHHHHRPHLSRSRSVSDSLRSSTAWEANETSRSWRTWRKSSQRSWVYEGRCLFATLDCIQEDRSTTMILRLETLMQGVSKINEMEVSCTIRSTHLADLLQAFALSTSESEWLHVPPSLSRQEFEFGSCIVHSFSEEAMQVEQPRVLEQWHQNACGYHALFNAACVLDVFPSHLNKSSNVFFWGTVMQWSRMLDRQNELTHAWSCSSIRSLTVDLAHLKFIVENDIRLQGKVHVFSSIEELEGVGQKDYSAALVRVTRGQPQAFVIGCFAHWDMVAIDAEGRCWFADSFNKPILQFTQSFAQRTKETQPLEASQVFGTPDDLSDRVLEQYKPKFVRKLKMSSPFYMHLPEDRFDELFENGVEEFWKGKVKNELYWSHRPRKIRKMLLTNEILAAAAFVDRVLGDLRVLLRAPSESIPSPPVMEKVANDLEVYFERNTTARRGPIALHTSGTVLLNLSEDTAYRGFVRKEEDWPKESPQYKAGNRVENRKKPPPEEVLGDVFDRQRVIVGFDQALVERQVCLVVGTGGVGQNTALALARLGVDKIILLDFDAVEASNLTRQCLSGLGDIGLRKVDAARMTLHRYHNLRSDVLTFDGDVVKNWPLVVSMARQSTAMFNCADVGVMFDYCMNALSKELSIPVVSGQSFAWKFMTECFSGLPGKACAFCQENTRNSFGIGDVEKITERLNQYCADSPVQFDMGGGRVDWASLLGDFLENDSQFRVFGATTAEIITACVARMEKPDPPIVPREIPSSWMKRFLVMYHDLAIEMLSPGQITSLKDLGFIPRPVFPQTRFFGSWVCPCLACGTFMVSHWMNYLTAPNEKKDPPTHIVFNMDEGMTAEEQMGYELGLGLSLDERSFCRSTPSESHCGLCKHANSLQVKKQLMFGAQIVHLAPVKGSVLPPPVFYDRDRQNSFDLASPPAYGSPDLVFPVVPVTPPVMKETCSDVVDPELCPEFSSLPLLKCSPLEAEEKPSSLQGFASGVRSAVAVVRGRAYRFKGCGNNSDGLVIQEKGDHGEKMIRGCLFPNTASQEMYMTKVVDKLLRAETGMVCANRPVCVYKYDTNEMANPLLKDQPCYGCVYETLGDRRLGDHLLYGLEKLIPLLYTPYQDDSTWRSEMEILVQGRRGKESNSDGVWDTCMIVIEEGPTADMRDARLKEDLRQLSLESMDELLGGNKELCALWKETVQQLKDCLSSLEKTSSQPSVLLHLAGRLGRECGLVCSVLERSEISWGTYPDATGIHCNAHTNNFVVLSPFQDMPSGSDGQRFLLAPLDFDMSFAREAFLPQVVEKQHQSSGFPDTWQGLVQYEQRSMRDTLAGSDFASTGVTNAVDARVRDDASFNLVRCMFRDTLVSSFDEALHGRETPCAFDKDVVDVLDQACQYLVSLALMLTFTVTC